MGSRYCVTLLLAKCSVHPVVWIAFLANLSRVGANLTIDIVTGFTEICRLVSVGFMELITFSLTELVVEPVGVLTVCTDLGFVGAL